MSRHSVRELIISDTIAPDRTMPPSLRSAPAAVQSLGNRIHVNLSDLPLVLESIQCRKQNAGDNSDFPL